MARTPKFPTKKMIEKASSPEKEKARSLKYRDFSFRLADVCESINGHFSGSGETLLEADLETCVSFLRGRLDAWLDSSLGGEEQKAYDESMKSLVKAVLAIYERRTASLSEATSATK